MPTRPAAATLTLPAARLIEVHSEHQIAEARRATWVMLKALGFSGAAGHYVVTAVSELAANLVFHAHQGQHLLLRPVRDGMRIGIEVRAEDSGPGIAELADALRDGFSTNGGLGAGLPGVKRLMDDFDIDSEPGRGTRVVARKWLR